MASVVIGPLTIEGTTAQNFALQPIAEKITQVLGSRIKALTIVVKPRTEMPRYRKAKPGDKPGDGHAQGFWRERKRLLMLSADLFGPNDPLAATLGHEIIHALFSDGIENKADMLPLLIPEPENFGDQVVNGEDLGYVATPEEALCTWGSHALFGFAPVNNKLYKRTVDKTSLPALKAILLGTVPAPPEDPLDKEVKRLQNLLKEVGPLAEQIKTKAGQA